jgi:putative transposase
MRNEAWETTGNAVYNAGYHLVGSLKYRRAVLKPPMDSSVKDILIAIGVEKGFRGIGLAVMSDPILLLVSAPPRVSPAEIAR